MNAKDLKNYELKEKKNIKADDSLPVILIIWSLGTFMLIASVLSPYDFVSGVMFIISLIVLAGSCGVLWISQESEFVLVRK